MSEVVGQFKPRPRGETRRRILNIAADWLQQRGYHGFSFAQIADELQIRSGAVHYHFRGKADLVEAVFARYREEFAWWCGQLPEGPRRSVDWVERFLDLEAKNIERGRVCPLGLAGVEFASLPAAACREAEALRDDLRNWLTDTLHTGRANGELAFSPEPQDMAQLLMASAQGAIQLARLQSPGDFLKVRRALLASLGATAAH